MSVLPAAVNRWAAADAVVPQLLVQEPWRFPMAAQHLAAIKIQQHVRGVLLRRDALPVKVRERGGPAAGSVRTPTAVVAAARPLSAQPRRSLHARPTEELRWRRRRCGPHGGVRGPLRSQATSRLAALLGAPALLPLPLPHVPHRGHADSVCIPQPPRPQAEARATLVHSGGRADAAGPSLPLPPKFAEPTRRP